jgi:choline monooxygenase
MTDRLAKLLHEFDATLPLERARTIPREWYSDEEMYQRERSEIFAATWQYIGRSEQLKNKGDFLTVDVAGEPVLAIRDDAGQLRAMSNVCRHRAAVIMDRECGTATKLRCRYHGWTYDLTGSLRGVPEFDRVEEFCREEQGLPNYEIAEWAGLVWVRIAPPTSNENWSTPLRDFLAPMPETVEPRGVGTLQFHGRSFYEFNCNWKVAVDNYLDGGYHVNTVHPALASVLDYSQYTSVPYRYTSLQSGPLVASDDPTMTLTRSGDKAMYWYVFPNFMLNLYDGVMDTNLVQPLGPNRCRVIFDYFFDARFDEAYRTESMKVADQVQAEDIGICADVQKGLQGASYRSGRYSVKREAAAYHFHRLLAERLDS